MVVVTQKELSDGFCRIRGVKSVDIQWNSDGRCAIFVDYRFYTYCLPWLLRRAKKSVFYYIYDNTPFNSISISSVTAKKED